MNNLTITTIVLGVVVLLLILVIGIFIGRKRSSRDHPITSKRLENNVPRHRSTAVSTQPPPTQNSKTSSRNSRVEPHIAVTETVISVQNLEAKLLVRLSRDQMSRNKEFERQRNPHLDEIALLEKMLYDLERGR